MELEHGIFGALGGRSYGVQMVLGLNSGVRQTLGGRGETNAPVRLWQAGSKVEEGSKR